MLRGGVFDLNATPDMLPAAAACAAYAQGESRLVNVAHARIKETDRIACMAAELGKLGAQCTELPDGLCLGHLSSGLHDDKGDYYAGGIQTQRTHDASQGAAIKLDGHGDHRIVMALAAAALGASSPVEISGAEAADITYPEFLDLLKNERE
jgi:3-phosphoshikimate 1-carboxyvinyltransferase